MATASSNRRPGGRWGTRSGTQADVAPFQGDLFAQGRPSVDASARLEHLDLGGRSWIDFAPRWLIGADELLEQFAARLRWTRAERPMYGQMVEEPRLGAHLRPRSAGVPGVVDEMATALGDRYRCRFNSVWVNYYRGGRDSVAWHRDQIGVDPAPDERHLPPYHRRRGPVASAAARAETEAKAEREWGDSTARLR